MMQKAEKNMVGNQIKIQRVQLVPKKMLKFNAKCKKLGSTGLEYTFA